MNKTQRLILENQRLILEYMPVPKTMKMALKIGSQLHKIDDALVSDGEKNE